MGSSCWVSNNASRRFLMLSTRYITRKANNTSRVLHSRIACHNIDLKIFHDIAYPNRSFSKRPIRNFRPIENFMQDMTSEIIHSTIAYNYYDSQIFHNIMLPLSKFVDTTDSFHSWKGKFSARTYKHTPPLDNLM